MTDRSIDVILEEQLKMLQSGATVDQCLAAYPGQTHDLREQLIVAQDLFSQRGFVPPDAAALAKGRARLLNAVTAQRSAPAERPGLFAPLGAFFAERRLLTLLPRAVPAVVAMVVLGGAAWGVSAATTGEPNPGGWLAASSADDDERVEIRGTLSAIDTAALALTITTPSGDVVVYVTERTEFEDENETPLTLGAFATGDAVKVSAVRDETGALIARKLELERDDAPDTNEDLATPDDIDEDDDADDRGPGNADEDDGDLDDEADGADDGDEADEPDDRDNRGPGNADEDDDDDRSGPDSGKDDENDHSGPGGGADEEPDDESDD